jgi:uncharacterized protein (DUF58 family)
MRHSPLLLPLSTLSGWALFLGILFDRPELFIVAVPLIGAFLSARRPATSANVQATVALSATQVCEGETMSAILRLGCSLPVPLLEIALPLPDNIVPAGGSNRLVVHLSPGAEIERTVQLRAVGRGRCRLGRLQLRLFDRAGLVLREVERDLSSDLHIYPRPLAVRHLPSPRHPFSSFGNYISPRFGDGLEPGDIRPVVAGDRVRHVNWPASLRLGRLHVTEYQQERNADIVLLLDTYAEAGGRPETTLDAAVRAAAALAAAYVSRRDRVGFVELGGVLRWIRPMSGRRHLQGLVETMLPAGVTFTYVIRDLDVVPPRVVPPRALVIAISPLLDDRFIMALHDLAARRFDLVVLAVSPIGLVHRVLAPSLLTDVAHRLWAAERRIRLNELRRGGLTILDWDLSSRWKQHLQPWGRVTGYGRLHYEPIPRGTEHFPDHRPADMDQAFGPRRPRRDLRRSFLPGRRAAALARSGRHRLCARLDRPHALTMVGGITHERLWCCRVRSRAPGAPRHRASCPAV